MLRLLAVAILGVSLPLAAYAGAIVESLKGEVQVDGVPIMPGQRLVAPLAVATGAGAQVFLKFEDDMQIVLGENSLFRIVDFRHSSSAVADRAVFDLLRGSARVVTGKIARDNPKQFFFRTPQTQLMVEQPSDFTVALVNPAYISVKTGSVLSSNGWGQAALGAGSTTSVGGAAVAPVAIAPSAMPTVASSAMNGLSVAAVSAPAGTAAVGVGSVAAGLGGAAVVTPVVVGAAVVAGVAAAANNSDGASTPATTTHH